MLLSPAAIFTMFGVIVAPLLGGCDDPEPECHKSKFNCKFDNPAGGNRVRRADGVTEVWPIVPPLNGLAATLRDGHGQKVNVWDEGDLPPEKYEWAKAPYTAKFNWGQTRWFAGKMHAFAVDSPNDSATWVPIDAIVDSQEFTALVGEATLDGKSKKASGKSLGMMGCYTIRNSHDPILEALHVTKDVKFGDTAKSAADYLSRPRWPHMKRSVNLTYNVPGAKLGGTAIDHFPAGTRFRRLRVEMDDPKAPPLLDIDLYVFIKSDGKNWTLENADRKMIFLYGYITSKTGEKRYGWMSLDALKPGCLALAAGVQGGSLPDPDLPVPPTPLDPPDPPDPCSDCVNAHCSATLAACNSNSECGAIYACVDTCPEPCLSCWPGCYQQHPNGRTSFTEHEQCMVQQCYEACNSGAPCYDQTVGCNNNPECTAIWACINTTCPQDCPADNPSCALPCWAACGEQHPAGKDQFTALTQCQNSGC